MVDLDDGWNEGEEEVKQAFKRQRLEKVASVETAPLATTVASSSTSRNRLPDPVASLVRLLFDKEMMKKQLVSLEVDIRKMPLGKISKKQILQGYEVLTQIQDLLTTEKTPSLARLADCANRLYTLIPHDFGHNAPPLIDNLESVKKKMNLLDTLIDIEIATNLMKDTDENSSEVDQLDGHYKSLKTNLVPVDKNSDLFKLLETYALNTQDKTVYAPQFVVEEIFEVERENEMSRFDPFKGFPNRQLLWHGSRLTNWVGILSQGLRIAPPEAPKTGYRFGKGVYFADCVAKSTSYCFSTRDSPTAVLLLAEVALGSMNELKHDQYMEKPPAGTHSTKALGMSAPDPKEDKIIENSIKVPLGKITKTGLSTSCTHNEFIVYDVSQIHIRYLLRVRINHK